MTNRRLFLFGAAAALTAPAIVRPESLMKLFVPNAELLVPEIEEVVRYSGGPISRAQLLQELLPGLNALFGVTRQYSDVFAE